jgi:hypothetical protein
MDLDDRQAFTNGVKTMVECADIMRAEIQKHPFSDEQTDAMVLTYWHALITSAFTPDFSSLMKQMFKRDD